MSRCRRLSALSLPVVVLLLLLTHRLDLTQLSTQFALSAIVSPVQALYPPPQLLARRVAERTPPHLARAQWRAQYAPSNVSIVSIVTSGYRQWTDHLVANMRALGLLSYLRLITNDGRCHAYLLASGINVQLTPSSTRDGSGSAELRYGTVGYQKLVHQLPAVVLREFRVGRSVLYLDADITLLANPLAYLAPLGGDMYVQDDLRKPDSRFNGGFFFAAASSQTERVFIDMDEYIRAHPTTNNQPAFNWALLRHARRLRIHVLDPLLFANGQAFFDLGTAATRILPVLVHHNFAVGVGTKVERARRHGLLVERADLGSLLANYSMAHLSRTES